MPRVFLGLGSNAGDRRLEFLRAAYRELARMRELRVMDASPLYETEPWEREPGTGTEEQRWHLNCVIAIDTTLSPAELLERMQAVETALERERPPGTPEVRRFALHTMDIDILLYEVRVLSVPDDLHIPHLLLHEREFVLRPLADIAPDLRHPVLYQTIRELLEELRDEHEVRPAPYPRRWFEG
jgi:dihydroneopterin aldolase/2-amino-4-hydroxy-6-hydroxymethyldihydropteridine diphosphokinase